MVQNNQPTDKPRRYYRKVIRICAEDSPNVKLGLLQKKLGLPVTNKVILPGVLTYDEYVKRRLLWDEIRQAISLDARFYTGQTLLLYPPEWLDRAERFHVLNHAKTRQVRGIGIDPGEGVANTSMVAVDELGIVEIYSVKTPDTSQILDDIISFIRKHNVDPRYVCIDRGGGGKQHADYLRQKGYNIRTVAFGETMTIEPRRSMILTDERIDTREKKAAYKNRRAQMYGMLRDLLDPINPHGFGIPKNHDIRKQLAPIPLLYDGNGVMYLPPKNKVPGSKVVTLTEIIGKSPDEADALVLAIFAMTDTNVIPKAGAASKARN